MRIAALDGPVVAGIEPDARYGLHAWTPIEIVHTDATRCEAI